MKKPAYEMTDDELRAAWEAGMYHESCVAAFTAEQAERHREIEREMDRRPGPSLSQVKENQP